jgi:hypothetical protein
MDLVAWKDADISWKEFKTLIYKERNWAFKDYHNRAMQGTIEENRNIWNKIGPSICEYYRQEQGIDIKFQQAKASAKKKE